MPKKRQRVSVSYIPQTIYPALNVMDSISSREKAELKGLYSSVSCLVSGITWIGQNWLVQCQDSMTEWDIVSWCIQHGIAAGQHYKVTKNVHCHKTVP